MVKCYNPRCGRTAHKGRKKCFQCLLSNAKYMRYYRERRQMARIAQVIARTVSYVTSRAAEQLAIVVDQEMMSIPVSAPPAGKSLGVSGSNAAQP